MSVYNGYLVIKSTKYSIDLKILIIFSGSSASLISCSSIDGKISSIFANLRYEFMN